MTKQDVENKCKEVAISIKGVLEATKAMRELCKSRPPVQGTFKREEMEALERKNELLLEKTKETASAAVDSLRRLEAAVEQGNNQEFVVEAKSSATKLAQLIETSKTLGIEREEARLKQASLKLISAGKVALRTPGDELYRKQLTVARENVEEAMKSCVRAIQSRLLASKRDSIIMDPTQSNRPQQNRQLIMNAMKEQEQQLQQQQQTEPTKPSTNSTEEPPALSGIEPNWSNVNNRYSLPDGIISELFSRLSLTEDQSSVEKVVEQVVTNLERQFPHLKEKHDEIATSITAELHRCTSEDPTAPVESDQDENVPEEKSDTRVRLELEKISALDSYSEWRKLTMTRRKANKTKSELMEMDWDELELTEEKPDEADPKGKKKSKKEKKVDPKKQQQQLKALATGIGDAALEFIVTANEHVLKPRNRRESLDETARQFYELIKKALILSLRMGKALGLPPIGSTIIHNSIQQIAEAKCRGELKEDCIDAASFIAARMVESNEKKRVFYESNAVRVLTLQLLSAIHSIINTNKGYAQFIFLCAIVTALMESCWALMCATETSIYISLNQHKGGTMSTNNIPAMLSDEQTVSSIWDELEEEGEPKIVYDEEDKTQISFASLNRLIEALTSVDNYDGNFLHTFITTYQSFITPYQLYEKLLERYDAPPKYQEDANTIRLRVSVVLKYWIGKQFADLDDDLIENVYSFINNKLASDGQDQLASLLQKEITKKIENRISQRNAMFAPPEVLKVQTTRSLSEIFLLAKDQDIAEQLTLVESNLYCAIEPQELLNQSWNSPKLQYRAPNVIAMINRANAVSFWVASMILLQEKPRDRKKMVDKFISVAEALRKLNNFHTLMGIIAGLNTSSVSRLRSIKSEISKKTLSNFKKHEELMNPEGNFQFYRDTIHASHLPCIPYLGVYLKDLTFIEDGNPDTVNGLVNFFKRHMIFLVIQEVQQFQAAAYDFPIKEPLHTFVLKLPKLDEKQLYDLSLFCEPRGRGK
eukprot:CAMPEP_0174257274 /NCGR_PEP_ID=MMETSP0439-20130205/6438_1 /TAXON_ID=0 /ORGANISM="Stereomyxa ramosa, Strain Chinc5" /LENGTH=993 /DNA_ID=CAMNT_0015340291 /DNA_START=75 /DNA_END=3056 /DNA_ORIENTATION=+